MLLCHGFLKQCSIKKRTNNGPAPSIRVRILKVFGKRDKKIHFTGVNENGEKGGMVAEIAEYIPNSYVSIRHLGILDKGKEILSGPTVEEWAGALENYSFSAIEGQTLLKVDVDTNDEYIDYFNEAWPDALQRLKEISETE